MESWDGKSEVFSSGLIQGFTEIFAWLIIPHLNLWLVWQRAARFMVEVGYSETFSRTFCHKDVTLRWFDAQSRWQDMLSLLIPLKQSV